MRIKRVVTSITASFDQFISKMENHDAMAKCVIDDVRQSAAKMRGEKLRVERRLSSINAEILELEKSTHTWKERARSCMDVNEDKAKACLKQMSMAQKQLVDKRHQQSQLEAITQKIDGHLRSIEQKISDLESRRIVLSSRQAKAKVAGLLDEQQLCNSGEDLFDRWEEQVMHREYSEYGAVAEETAESSLAKEFELQEEDEGLALALEALREESKREESRQVGETKAKEGTAHGE